MSQTTRTRQAVAATVLVGVAGAAAVVLLPLPYRPRVHHAAPWTLSLLASCCLGELAYVRVRHGDTAEDLTFYEAVVAAGVLLLTPAAALLVPLAALVLASAVMRRSPIKAVFNLGAYAASTAAMVAVYAALGHGREPFSALSVAAALLGGVSFAAVNLLALAAVVAAGGGRPVRTVLAEEWRLSGVMAVGNVGLGAVAVALALRAPALLPFAALPALALAYAYRAVARGVQERARATVLLALGTLPAHGHRPQRLIGEMARVVREAFDAALVQVEVPSRGWHAEQAAPSPAGASLTASADGGALGTVRVVVHLAPTAGGRGSRPWPSHRQRVPDADRVLLTSIAGTLASALDAAVHADALREESAKLSSVVEHAGDGIVVLDETGAVTVWSPALQALTGRPTPPPAGTPPTAGELLHRLVRVLVGPAPVGLEQPRLGSVLGPEHPRAELPLTLHRPDGEQRRVRASVSAIFDPHGRARKLVAIVHDITREEQVARLKTDFVATVSHELRTPITPIKGYVRLLVTRGAAMTDEQRTRALSVIEDRIDHLARLVDDLLLASKVSGGGLTQLHVQPAAHDLTGLVREAVGDVPALAGRVTVDAPGPVAAQCDATRTRQCLTNLLTNAAKYSPPGSPVHVAVHAGRAAGPVSVTVTDHGRGIPHDQLQLIFERFHRVEDAMTMTTDGTGLGLYVTRELARAMGGNVSVLSTLGSGSQFTLHLPAAASQASAA